MKKGRNGYGGCICGERKVCDVEEGGQGLMKMSDDVTSRDHDQEAWVASRGRLTSASVVRRTWEVKARGMAATRITPRMQQRTTEARSRGPPISNDAAGSTHVATCKRGWHAARGSQIAVHVTC